MKSRPSNKEGTSSADPIYLPCPLACDPRSQSISRSFFKNIVLTMAGGSGFDISVLYPVCRAPAASAVTLRTDRTAGIGEDSTKFAGNGHQNAAMPAYGHHIPATSHRGHLNSI